MNIPKAVQEQERLAEQLMQPPQPQQGNGEPEEPEPTEIPASSEPETPETQEKEQASEKVEGFTALDHTYTEYTGEMTVEALLQALNIEMRRNSTLQGKYNAEVPRLMKDNQELRDKANESNGGAGTNQFEIDRLTGEITRLQGLLQTKEEAPTNTEQAMAVFSKEYGEDFVSTLIKLVDEKTGAVNQRVDQVQDKFQQSDAVQEAERKNAEIQRLLAPKGINYASLNSDPLFANWLNETTNEIGQKYGAIANAAYSNEQFSVIADICTAYWKSLKDEFAQPTANPSSQQPPLATPTSVPAEVIAPGAKVPWTEAQIEQLYADGRAGRITPEEFERLEKEMHESLMP